MRREKKTKFELWVDWPDSMCMPKIEGNSITATFEGIPEKVERANLPNEKNCE